ncbi:hypothetical protein SO802_002424 [Lithocarpus litseifolius]|uniref:Uncharacterized protein n=1 Tax=Lithocarpus litseifolius TaxID=425828 RepID=A0AAW2E1A2_9ROSI
MDFVYQGKNPPTKLVAMPSASNAALGLLTQSTPISTPQSHPSPDLPLPNSSTLAIPIAISSVAPQATAVQSSTLVISSESNKANSTITSAQSRKASSAPEPDYTTTKPPSNKVVA